MGVIGLLLSGIPLWLHLFSLNSGYTPHNEIVIVGVRDNPLIPPAFALNVTSLIHFWRRDNTGITRRTVLLPS